MYVKILWTNEWTLSIWFFCYWWIFKWIKENIQALKILGNFPLIPLPIKSHLLLLLTHSTLQHCREIKISATMMMIVIHVSFQIRLDSIWPKKIMHARFPGQTPFLFTTNTLSTVSGSEATATEYFKLLILLIYTGVNLMRFRNGRVAPC